MNIRLRRFLIVGATLYVAFLSWFFLKLKPGLGVDYSGSDIYTNVGNCQGVSEAVVAPTTDEVFDAKLSLPIKSVSATKKAFRKRRSSMPMAKSSLGDGKSNLYKFLVTPVGGGLHLVSDKEFRSFGAEGLMYLPMPQHLKRKNQGESPGQMPMMFPYVLMPENGTASPSGDAVQAVPSPR